MGYFSSTMGEMEDSRLLCEVSRAPSTPLKGTFLLLRCDCAVPLLILERMMVQSSFDSLPDLVFFTVPQADSCKSIMSSEGSTGFRCDNDLQKTTSGERMCLTHTSTHQYTIHTSVLHASSAISTVLSELTHINTHPFCANCRQRQKHPSQYVLGWGALSDGVANPAESLAA